MIHALVGALEAGSEALPVGALQRREQGSEPLGTVSLPEPPMSVGVTGNCWASTGLAAYRRGLAFAVV